MLNRNSERIPRPAKAGLAVITCTAGGFVERLQAAKQRSTKCHCLSLHARAEQGDANNQKNDPLPYGRRFPAGSA